MQIPIFRDVAVALLIPTLPTHCKLRMWTGDVAKAEGTRKKSCSRISNCCYRFTSIHPTICCLKSSLLFIAFKDIWGLGLTIIITLFTPYEHKNFNASGSIQKKETKPRYRAYNVMLWHSITRTHVTRNIDIRLLVSNIHGLYRYNN